MLGGRAEKEGQLVELVGRLPPGLKSQCGRCRTSREVKTQQGKQFQM